MTIRNELKELILSRYKSVRDFAISLQIRMMQDAPYLTITSGLHCHKSSFLLRKNGGLNRRFILLKIIMLHL